VSTQDQHAALAPPPLARIVSPARGVALLLALIWFPLAIFVLYRARLGEQAAYVLLPAIPAVLILYGWALRSWRHSRVALFGVTLVCFWLLIAVTVPFLPLADPDKPVAPYVLPGMIRHGALFLLGSDTRGRDVLSRTLWGCQRVLVWGVTATLMAYMVGVCFGLLAGYLRGWWDEIVSFASNVLLSFPVMVLLILVLNVLGQSGFNIIIAVTCSSAPIIMRIVRGLVLEARSLDYVLAAQIRGESPLWIMVVELLPSVRGPLVVDACLRLGYTTVAITTLTFLGLGLQPPDPDWGLMIKEAATAALLWKFSYMLIVPALAVTSLILGFNLIADGLRQMSWRG
jgi:peptide/nickel transport system permease protein